MADEIICPRCQGANPKGTESCIKCGTSLEKQNVEAEVDPMIGAFVGERFLVSRKLGEGGMGVVYEAEQTAIDRKVALKVLHPHLTDENLYARFRNEAASCSRLVHPNTITVYDFGKTETDSLYIAMEFIEGISLDDEIEKNGALDWRRAGKICLQICGSLQEAHDNGIVHRDLKPENVMLCERGGEKDIVKVLDFGIAKIMEDDGKDQRKALTKTGMVFGTPQYMSPEQVRGEKVDARSDIYSTGIILYQMLSGLLPFKSETPMGVLTMHLLDTPPALTETNPALSVPKGLEAIALDALAKKPDDRPESMKEMARRIQEVLSGSTGLPVAPAVKPPASVGGVADTVRAPVADSAMPIPPTVESASPVIRSSVEKKGGKTGLIIGIIAGAVVLMGGGGTAAWYFLSGPGAGRAPKQPIAIPQPYIQPQNLQAGVTQPQIVPPVVPDVQVLPDLPADPVIEGSEDTATGGKTSGKKSGTGAKKPKKDAACMVMGGSDPIGKAIANTLSNSQGEIKACAKLYKNEPGAKLAFKVKKGTSRPASIVNAAGGKLGGCLSKILNRPFNETNDKNRSGNAGFTFEHSQGAIKKCGVGVNVKPDPVRRRSAPKKPADSTKKKKGGGKAKKKPTPGIRIK